MGNKLYKSGIYVVILAEIRTKLVLRSDVIKIKKIYSFTVEVLSSIFSLHFSDLVLNF